MGTSHGKTVGTSFQHPMDFAHFAMDIQDFTMMVKSSRGKNHCSKSWGESPRLNHHSMGKSWMVKSSRKGEHVRKQVV